MNYEVQCNFTDCFYKFSCVRSLVRHIKNKHCVQKLPKELLPCEIVEISSNLNNDIVNLTKETNAILHLFHLKIYIPSELLKDKYVPEVLCDNE